MKRSLNGNEIFYEPANQRWSMDRLQEGRKERRKWRWLGGNNNAIEWDWYVTGRKRTKSQWALIGVSSLYLIKWNEMLRVARARYPNQWPVTSDYSLTFHTRPATLTPMWPMCLWSRQTNGTPAPSSFLILLFNLLSKRSTALSCPALPCCIIINQSASSLGVRVVVWGGIVSVLGVN